MMKNAVIFLMMLMGFISINAYAQDIDFSQDIDFLEDIDLSEEYQPHGPFSLKNQMPLYIFFLSFTPDKAEVVEEGRLRCNLDYQVSNVIIDKVTTGTEEYIVQIDTEVNRINLDLKYGIREGVEIGLEIPYIRFSRGYLDGFIQDFEDVFEFITTPGARENTSKYQYKYEVRKSGEYLIQSNTPHGGVGDAILNLKVKFLDEDYNYPWPTLSVKGALKLPTGSKDKLTGNEKWEGG